VVIEIEACRLLSRIETAMNSIGQGSHDNILASGVRFEMAYVKTNALQPYMA